MFRELEEMVVKKIREGKVQLINEVQEEISQKKYNHQEIYEYFEWLKTAIMNEETNG